MIKLPPFVILAVLVAAFAVAPGSRVRRGTDDSVTATCTPDCGVWTQSAVQVQFSWTNPGTGETTSPACTDTDPVDTEGDTELTCEVTYPDTTVKSATVHVLIDRTPPTFSTASPTLQPNLAGWFALPFSVNFGWTDALSGVDPAACGLSVPYSGGATVDSTCQDRAGNVAPAAWVPGQIRQHAAPERRRHPRPRARRRRGLVHARRDLRLLRHRSLARLGDGPVRHRHLHRPGHPRGERDRRLQRQRRQPHRRERRLPLRRHQARRLRRCGRPRARPQRLVHASGRVQFPGHRPHVRDRLLQHAHLLRPGRRHRPAAGSCTDGAGNVGTKTISFKYDSSPPGKSKPFAVPGNRTIGVSWAPPSDAASFVVTRAPAGGPAVTIYRGSDHDYVDQGLRNGRKYTYAITSLDAAGNQSAPVAISAVPDGSTLRPFLDTEVSQPPTLSWAKARKAHYYNLQLYRGRTKVLSVWPTSSRVQIKSKLALQPAQVLPQAGALPLVRLARHRAARRPTGTARWWARAPSASSSS